MFVGICLYENFCLPSVSSGRRRYGVVDEINKITHGVYYIESRRSGVSILSFTLVSFFAFLSAPAAALS